jgi:hypothetical protein
MTEGWTMKRKLRAIRLGAVLAATVGAIAAVPAAASPGHNGRIVFERLVGPNFTSQIATVDPVAGISGA